MDKKISYEQGEKMKCDGCSEEANAIEDIDKKTNQKYIICWYCDNCDRCWE